MGLYSRKDRDGKDVWWIDYYVGDVRRRERVGYSKSDAEDALESRHTDIRREKFDGILPDIDCTIDQIKSQYLKHSGTHKSAQTAAREKGILDAFKEHFKKKPINKVTVADLENYRTQRIDLKKSPATVNKELQTFKNVLKLALKWKKINRHRIGADDLKPLKVAPGRVKYLESGDIPKLLGNCVEWLRPIILIDMNTGMRRGEIVSLTRANLDKKNRLIVLEKTKNGERRVIPMNQTVFEVFESLPPRIDTPYVFAEADGKAYTLNKVTMAFRRAANKSGLKTFRLHDLRHHFASYLTMKGQNSRTVQELLGHKDPRMTMRYSHLSPEHLKAAVESLDTPKICDRLVTKNAAK